MLKNLMSASGVSLVRAFVQFSMTIVLTRFLDPATYGVMAFVLPIWTFITLISEMGLGNAIVRAPNVTPEESGGAFKISMIAAVVGATAMVALAYPAQRLLDDPRVLTTVASMAVVLVFAMVATVPRALLERELRYVLIARVEIMATALAVPVCIGTAILGGGIWSLISYYLIIQLVRFFIFILLVRGKINLSGALRLAKPLVVFGGWVLAFNVQNFLARNADNIIIGTYIGTAALGLYGLSYQIMTLPLLVITWPASSILLATISKYTHSRSDTTVAYRYAKALFSVTAAVVFPMCTYLICGIDYLVQSYMGRAWHDVPNMLLWMAPVGALQAIAAYSGAILMATSHVKLQLYYGFFSTTTYVIVFAIAARFGLVSFVICYAITSALLAIGHLHFIVKYCLTAWRTLALTLMPGMVAAVCGAACYEAGVRIRLGGDLAQWLTATGLFVLGSVAGLWLMRRSLVDEVAFLVKGKQQVEPESTPAA